MQQVTLLVIFITLYLISNSLSQYTLLSNYQVYSAIPDKIKYFKILTCKPCNIFWIYLTLSFIVSTYMEYNNVIFALLAFLIAKIDDIWEYINNN